jgi:hypothetical protein
VIGMTDAVDSLPNDIEILKQLVRTRGAELSQARAEASNARAEVSSAEALITHLRLTIEKFKRDLFGPRNERKARLIDQMELQLEELEAAATEDEVAAEKAAAATTQVRAFTRRKPARQPFPAHLPRERIVVPGPSTCACCGSTRLAKLGEDVTETLEVVPRQWKVVQHVREKFTCRDCEKINQPPAPFHVLPRGFAGPSLLAMILFEKYGSINRSTGSPSVTRARALISASRPSPTRWGPALLCCARSTSSSARTCLPAIACTAMRRRCRCWPPTLPASPRNS